MKSLLLFSLLVLLVPNQSFAGDPSVATIKAAWAETIAKTESCRFHWSETRRNAADEAKSYTYSLFLKNEAHLRVERLSKQFDADRNRNVTETYVTTYDGQIARSFYGSDVVDAKLYPTGFVGFQASDWDNYHVLPILFALRPINGQFSPINEHEYTIADKAVEIGDRKLLELSPKSAESNEAHYIYYVDPARSFTIARVVLKWNNHIAWQLDLSHRLDEVSECWVPKSWELRTEITSGGGGLGGADVETGALRLKSVVEFVEVDSNVEIADEIFAFEFPSQALITDWTFTKPLVYLLCEDGRKRVITSEERKDGINYLDYLAAIRTEKLPDRN